MTTATEKNADAGRTAPKASSGSDMDPTAVTPGSKADPSAEPEWEDHVQEYFNQDAHPGEAVPMATHEAKE